MIDPRDELDPTRLSPEVRQCMEPTREPIVVEMTNAGHDDRFYTQRELAALRAENERLRAALADMHAGWRYIRETHGDLYGVAWDRCDAAARAALEWKP